MSREEERLEELTNWEVERGRECGRWLASGDSQEERILKM